MTATRYPPAEPKQGRAIITRTKLLDAAVDELIELGYAHLTTQGVAQRAGISRGAQQRYFPHKDVLVTEAVRHLTQRVHAELRTRIEALPRDAARVQRCVDVIFELYSGQLFAATLELSFASRTEPDLAQVVAEQEQIVSQALFQAPYDLFPSEITGRSDFDQRWATVCATARGVAMLRLLGHRADVVAAQWRFARAELVRILVEQT